jgi:ApbE superfamily uncharacterized protein (UPF0280 family)
MPAAPADSVTPVCTPRPAAAAVSIGSCGALRARLPDGRWHFQHGPIDLIIGAHGAADAVDAAVEAAWARFQSVLTELVSELGLLRLPVQEAMAVRGPVARRMTSACWPHRRQFITPMAAVAGAVADELIEPFRAQPAVLRAYVNNGGDIALHLQPEERFRVGLVADLDRLKRREQVALDGDFEVSADMPVRGVATSGWRGRSFSLGIADSVTVLARSASEADAAATMIANAVNVDDPAIVRRRADELKDDTDLGERLVTVAVGWLSTDRVERALATGQAHAQRLLEGGTIAAAVLCLQGVVRLLGRCQLPAAAQALRARAAARE